MQKVKDLRLGQQFKIKGWRKFRTVSFITQIENREGIPEEHRGKMLVMAFYCKHMILDPETEIIII